MKYDSVDIKIGQAVSVTTKYGLRIKGILLSCTPLKIVIESSTGIDYLSWGIVSAVSVNKEEF